MITVKGFLNISERINNKLNETSVIGELSSISRTYSKDVGEYKSQGNDDYILYTFSCTDNTNDHVVLPQASVDSAISILNSIYGYVKTNQAPHDETDLSITVKNLNLNTLETIELGSFIDDGDIVIPEWVEFTLKNTNDTFRIWFCDESFRNQYDLFEIDVVSVLNDPNDFHAPFESVATMVSAVSTKQLVTKAQALRNVHPETVFHFLEFNLVNKNNPSIKISVPWFILIYGLAGDNLEYIKDAIEDYLVSNSDYNRDEWEVIFPDIFRRKEFKFFPMWNNTAIENLTSVSGLYSQIVSLEEVYNYASTKIPEFTPSDIYGNLEIFPHHYKYITSAVIKGNGNDSTNDKLYKLFKDYLPTPNTSLDFGRMTKNTRDWCMVIYSLMKDAEKATRYNTLTPGVSRVIRNNKLYVIASYNDINYLVYAKSNDN